jgi:hypothetical protein
MRNRQLSRLLGWGLPVAALLLLAGAGLPAKSGNECLDGSPMVTAGETVQLTATVPSWLLLYSEDSHVYRADVSGPEGSSLELWTTYSESGSCDLFSDQLVEQRESSAATESFEWTGTWYRALRVSPPAGADSGTYSVALAELAAPPVPRPLVIPVVAHRAGVGGALFQTDLELLNLGREATQVDLVFVPEAGGDERHFNTSLEPEQLLALDDVLLATFGLDDARGALLITSADNLVTHSSTYATAADGSYGQHVPAQRWGEAAGVGQWAGAVRTLLHVAGAPDYRSNVGFVEVLGLDAEVELELYDGLGALVASGTVTVPARSYLQVDDVFGYLGAAPLPHATMLVRVTSYARVFSYASVVDNRTSDPMYFPGLPDSDASRSLVVLGAASTDGANGTHWRTDLWVLPKGPATTLQVTFLPADGSSATIGSFPIPSAGGLALEDVVGLLGARGSGALLLEAEEPILATSRTYNLTADGTFGQLIPAQTSSSYTGTRRSTVLGVEGSEERRTNVGLFNPSRSTGLEVVLRLVSGQGVMLGSRAFQLEPLRQLQVNDIFGALHVAAQADCRVDFEVVGGEGWEGIHAYASVVDNRSGDPTYVPAESTSYRLDVPVELDNRRNAVLVDQLPGAVGLDPLPAGTLTATVTGSGNLGRPDLPIQVLCLYKNPAGELRSAALAVGGTVTDVGGGGRMWCVIPDWISTADNTGSVTVSLTGGDHDASLTLDARANAVALDSVEGPVVWARPSAETVQVVTTGDLGRPELQPQVLAMYREQGSQRLRVRTLLDGDTFGPVATDFQVLVAVLDWINREDNTGTTRLEQACTTRAGACNQVVSGSLSTADCQLSPPFAAFRVGERITFAGEAGQVVSLTGTSGPWWFHMVVVDPSGRHIAVSEETGDQGRTEITDLTLPVSGTYELWAVDHAPYYSSDAEAYTVEIACQGL